MFFPGEIAMLGCYLTFLFVLSRHPWYIRWTYFQITLNGNSFGQGLSFATTNFSRLWHGLEQTAN